jgi:HEAT repeat protein
VAPLLGLLQHADAGIRANAAWALGFSSGQQVQDALQAVVDKDPEPKVRAAARGALDRVQTTVTTPAAK